MNEIKTDCPNIIESVNVEGRSSKTNSRIFSPLPFLPRCFEPQGLSGNKEMKGDLGCSEEEGIRERDIGERLKRGGTKRPRVSVYAFDFKFFLFFRCIH